MNYNEEIQLHQSLTFSEFLALSEESRTSDNIYFITDVVSDVELINKLIEKIDELTLKMEQANLITKEG